MKKQIVKLNETQLYNLIKESIENVLNSEKLLQLPKNVLLNMITAAVEEQYKYYRVEAIENNVYANKYGNIHVNDYYTYKGTNGTVDGDVKVRFNWNITDERDNRYGNVYTNIELDIWEIIDTDLTWESNDDDRIIKIDPSQLINSCYTL